MEIPNRNSEMKDFISKIKNLKQKIFNQKNQKNQKKQTNTNKTEICHKLAIMCQFKNETQNIHTWLKHHIWQGVEHFYLIDDDSSDDTKEKLQEYIDLGIVSYYFNPGPKVNNYRWLFEKIKTKMKWLAVCDVNDYFYCLEKTLSRKLEELMKINLLLCNCYSYKYKEDELTVNENGDIDLRICALNRDIPLSKNTKYIFRPNCVSNSSQIWIQTLLYPLTNRMIQNGPRTRRENIVIRVNHYEKYNINEDDYKELELLNDLTLKKMIENVEN